MNVKVATINSVFYFKQNLDLAYSLKLTAYNYGIKVNYANTIEELIKKLNDYKVSIIFLDCTSVDITDEIVSFMKSYPSSKNPVIVCLSELYELGMCRFQNVSGIDHFINPKRLSLDIGSIYENLRYMHYKNLATSFNYSEINNYLTNYLLSIGLLPKHSGFTFIKQVIEHALRNNGVISSLSKEIYPAIAARNKTFPQNVERNIRNCISCGIKNKEDLPEELGYMFRNNKISNRAFLCYLLDSALSYLSENNSAGEVAF